MKEFTLGSSGSGGNSMGMGMSKDNDVTKINDAKVNDDGDSTLDNPK